MIIYFRTDASIKMGSGHVMRCLTLAEELKRNGAEIKFISRAHEGNLNTLIFEKDIKVIKLPKPDTFELFSEKSEDDNYEEWLGVSQKQDAEESIKALGNDQPDWLIVDHYALDQTWDKFIRPYVKNIMVIDDLANRYHDCNLLLDQNYSRNGLDRYKGKIPSIANGLFGPKFALLRPEYQKARQNLQIHNGTIKRVLIYFGDCDPQNLTTRTLEAFSQLDLESIFLDVVIGVNHQSKSKIQRLCKDRNNAKCQSMLPSLAGLMRDADLSIGAGGATTWERLCLGLPSIVITTGENQESLSESLAQDGYHQYLGPAEKVSTEMIIGAIKFLANSPKALERQSNTGKALVDGMGVQRVLKKLLN